MGAGEEFMYIGAALLFLKRQNFGRLPPPQLILATGENHLGESDLLGQVCSSSYFGGCGKRRCCFKVKMKR